jgi:hypothetical protein
MEKGDIHKQFQDSCPTPVVFGEGVHIQTISGLLPHPSGLWRRGAYIDNSRTLAFLWVIGAGQTIKTSPIFKLPRQFFLSSAS